MRPSPVGPSLSRARVQVLETRTQVQLKDRAQDLSTTSLELSPGSRLSASPGPDSGVFTNMGPTPSSPTGQRMSDSSATFSALWEPLYGVLRHSKVHLVQHDILSPGRGYVHRIAKSELQDITYLFPDETIYARTKTFLLRNMA